MCLPAKEDRQFSDKWGYVNYLESTCAIFYALSDLGFVLFQVVYSDASLKGYPLIGSQRFADQMLDTLAAGLRQFVNVPADDRAHARSIRLSARKSRFFVE